MAKKLMKGNEAVAEAAIQAGCKYFFGYPITPQSELPEYMARRLPEVGGCFLQAESEIAAINMVYGAAGAGARVMTSSSSPGISLKQEGISYIACAELPCVIVNMVRGGPGLGSIQPSQSDYFQSTKGGGHGDYHLIVLAPASVQEAVDCMMEGFDMADAYRTPVLVLGDGMIGQMMEPVEFKQPKKRELPPKDWATTGWDGKSRPRAIVNSLYIESAALEETNKRLQARYAQIAKEETRYEAYMTDDAEYIFAAYGTTARVVKTAIDGLRKRGVKAGLIRPITLWPFPSAAFEEVCKRDDVKAVITVEMSCGQMVEDVRLAVNGAKPTEFIGRVGGIVPSPESIVEKVLELEGGR